MYQIFMSYPTLADGMGEISEFKEHLQYRLVLKTGDPTLQIFQDKEDIRVGDDWQQRLAAALDGAGFLMPIVQPLFFRSEWCQREVLEFHALCQQRGRSGRILPILWEQTPALDRAPAGATDLSGQTAKLLSQHQWFDWTSWQLRDWGEAKRLELDRLAGQIAQALARSGAPAPGPSTAPPPWARPQPSAPGASARRQLHDLLLRMFSADELRRLVRWMPDGELLSADLPHQRVSSAELVTGLVELLAQHDRIDADFFKLLAEERPRRVAEIDAVRVQFGV